MIKHIVIFKRLKTVERQPELEAKLVSHMRSLNKQIDFIRAWKVSANELDRPICGDYILESSFDNLDALMHYLSDPAHVALIGQLKAYFEWMAADYTE
jgi:hypothetical protein